MRRLGLWTVLCCLLLAVALPAWAAPRVEMTVQAANEGRVKQGGWVTVMVDLTSQGAEMSGELVVEADGEMPHPQYVVPFTLPAGGKKRIPVSLKATGGMGVLVRLYAGGELVESKRVSLTWLPPQATMVGVLSGDEMGIPALNQLQAFQGQSAQVVRLTAATLPDRAALLADFDLIALSRFDSSALSKEQLRALEVWVGRGGTLLLAGGPEWKRTLAPLPVTLVPVEVTGVREVDLSPLADLAGRDLAGSGAVSEARLTAGQTLLDANGVPLIVSAAVGSGRVLYLAFDPGLNPVAGWAGQGQLYNRLLGSLTQTGEMFWPGEQDWMLTEALQRIPEWGLPGVWTLALLLGSYLLLVGPANYLILKRLDRREWAWLSVPGLSVLFLGLVYLIGFGRFQPLVSHLITVTELSPGGQSATVDSYLGLYAPSRSRMTVAVEDGRLVKTFIRGPVAQGGVTSRIVAGEKTQVELLSMTSYSMSGFSMQHEISLKGGLELVEAKVEGTTLSGRLKNSLNQPVDGLFIAAGSSFHQVGRLEPGQLSEPFALGLGEGVPLAPGRAVPARFAGSISVPDEAPGPDQARRRLMRDYVLQAIGSRMGGAVLVRGWTAEPLLSPNLPDLGKLVTGANMVYTVLPLPVGGDSAEIPPGMILGRPTDIKAVEWLPHGYILHPGTHTFTLLLPPVDPTRVGSVELDLRAMPDPTRFTVAVKNQKSGEWLNITGQTLQLPGWEEFVSPVGLIELRYESPQGHHEIQPPTVSVKGVRR
ncbi:MAG: hypothetical protein ACOY94_19420 [Bacillota bacterium]